jgi:hypothetical protein
VEEARSGDTVEEGEELWHSAGGRGAATRRSVAEEE